MGIISDAGSLQDQRADWTHLMNWIVSGSGASDFNNSQQQRRKPID
jgi:hypothetical protein